MIANGQITRIDRRSGATAAGDPVYTIGTAIAVDCCLDAPTNSMRWALGQEIKGATLVAYVEEDELPAGVTIGAGDMVVAQLEDEEAVAYGVEYVRGRKHGAVSHLEVFLRAL